MLFNLHRDKQLRVSILSVPDTEEKVTIMKDFLHHENYPKS